MANLRDLGLTEYEERTYRALLDVGPATAKELSEAADVPMGRIYDVLNGIETKRLVRSQTASRPKKYIAVEPETALERLLDERKRELSEKASQYDDIARELERELDGGPIAGEKFWTAALGPQESVDLLVERLDAADEHILLTAGLPSAQFDLQAIGSRITDHLESAANRGASVWILLSPDLLAELPEGVSSRYESGLADRDGFEVRVGEAVEGSLSVVDDTDVCIEVPNPLDQDEPFAMIHLQNPRFAADVRAEFEPRWEAGTSL